MNEAFKIDFTFIIITILVAVLYLILRRIFFNPLGNLLQEREQIIEGHQNELDSLKSHIEGIDQKIEGALNKAKKESIELNRKVISEAKENSLEMITRSKKEIKVLLINRVKEIEMELAQAEKEIVLNVKKFSNQLMKKIK